METLFPYATRDIHNFKLRTFGDGAIVDTSIFISELQSIENANVRVISILWKMVYAKSERKYFDLYRELTNIKSRGITEYFNRNRHDIRSMRLANSVNKLRTFENCTDDQQ